MVLVAVEFGIRGGGGHQWVIQMANIDFETTGHGLPLFFRVGKRWEMMRKTVSIFLMAIRGECKRYFFPEGDGTKTRMQSITNLQQFMRLLHC